MGGYTLHADRECVYSTKNANESVSTLLLGQQSTASLFEWERIIYNTVKQDKTESLLLLGQGSTTSLFEWKCTALDLSRRKFKKCHIRKGGELLAGRGLIPRLSRPKQYWTLALPRLA